MKNDFKQLLTKNIELEKSARDSVKAFVKDYKNLIKKHAIPIGTVIETTKKWRFTKGFKGKNGAGHRGWISGAQVCKTGFVYSLNRFVDGKAVNEALDLNVKYDILPSEYYRLDYFTPTSKKVSNEEVDLNECKSRIMYDLLQSFEWLFH